MPGEVDMPCEVVDDVLVEARDRVEDIVLDRPAVVGRGGGVLK